MAKLTEREEENRKWAIDAAIKAQITQPSQIVTAANKFVDLIEGNT